MSVHPPGRFRDNGPLLVVERAYQAAANGEINGLARDEGLEELLREDLGAEPELTEKAMFGRRAWLLNGNLLCGARDDGMLVRLGRRWMAGR